MNQKDIKISKRYNEKLREYNRLCLTWKLLKKDTVDQINRANNMARRIDELDDFLCGSKKTVPMSK